jgi:pseudaminic acid synthase
MATTVKIGNSILGDGYPSYIVAEMSGNHGGKFERAIEIIRAAKRAGADAIKLQTYTADTITLNCDREDFRLPQDSPWKQYATLHDLYKEAYTPWEWHKDLFAEARKIGIEIFSSPFDESAVDLLESLGANAYKIASPEITHVPLMKRVAQTRKPVVVSTGVCSQEDLDLAIETLRSNGCKELIILKCTTSYPAPLEDSNLRTIEDIKKRYECLSGLSDHTLGSTCPVVAVALGANFIEKHFGAESSEETVDSFFSLGEKHFTEMVKEIRNAEKAIGRASYEIPASAKSSLRGRRSLYVSSSVKKGEAFTEKNVQCVRPSFGLHPKFYSEILGKKAKRDLVKGDRLEWDVIEKDKV